MSDLRKGLAVLENDPIDAAGLRFERLQTLITQLAQELPPERGDTNPRAQSLVEFLTWEIDQAREEYRFLLRGER